MGRIKLLGVALAMAASVLAGTGGPAGAQGYEGWIWHPRAEVYWYCAWYGSVYWCWSPINEQWFRANPDWYLPENYNKLGG